MNLVFQKAWLADTAGSIISSGAAKACGKNCGPDLGTIVGTVTNSLLAIAAAVSVIMIIVGGFRYIISQGDPKDTVTARNTIMYAVIGLVITIIAYAIIHYVIGRF